MRLVCPCARACVATGRAANSSAQRSSRPPRLPPLLYGSATPCLRPPHYPSPSKMLRLVVLAWASVARTQHAGLPKTHLPPTSPPSTKAGKPGGEKKRQSKVLRTCLGLACVHWQGFPNDTQQLHYFQSLLSQASFLHPPKPPNPPTPLASHNPTDLGVSTAGKSFSANITLACVRATLATFTCSCLRKVFCLSL